MFLSDARNVYGQARGPAPTAGEFVLCFILAVFFAVCGYKSREKGKYNLVGAAPCVRPKEVSDETDVLGELSK
jgi:hypothetical protein